MSDPLNTSRKPTTPPLQNIPLRTETGRAARDAFQKDDIDKWATVATDYAYIEMAIMADALKGRI